MTEKIIIIHPDTAIRELLGRVLPRFFPDALVARFTYCNKASLSAIWEDVKEGKEIMIIVGSDYRDMEGGAFSFVRSVRDCTEKKVSIMMVSGGGGYFAKEAKEAGADCLLGMPFSMAELRERLQLLFPKRAFPA